MKDILSPEKINLSDNLFDVIIIGGGLAGLTAAIILSSNNKKVLVFEKKQYPFHKVCGEYVSNEILPFLTSLGFEPFSLGAAEIKSLRVSTPKGKNIYANLDLGGFGLSRYVLDAALYNLALKSGAQICTATKIDAVNFENNYFKVQAKAGSVFNSKIVIGSYGKRDMLDKKLNRGFIQSHTGYMGVKYHVKTNYPGSEIGLDNFKDGYCGIVKIEEDKYNICYLYKRNKHFNFKTIPELEEKILFKNPVIKNIFSNSEFLFDEPEVINEISFVPKQLIENHVLMCGDSAGLITPLCGNGMSMAVHGAKILCDLIVNSGIVNKSGIAENERYRLETAYKKEWNKFFKKRLYWGRTLQGFFGNTLLTAAFLRTIHAFPPFEKYLITRTHGKTITV